MSAVVSELAAELIGVLRAKGLTLSTAESCTGGAIATAVTSVPGSSDVFKGAVVAYANEVKRSLLGVSDDTLQSYGAVSEQTVREMVQGVARATDSDCAVATSGVAGPGGGTPDKPVGTVWVAFYVKGRVVTSLLRLPDHGRMANIGATVEKTLSELLGLACEY